MKHAILWTCMFASFAASAETTIDPASIYSSHCAACHGADRLGGMGPALLPESLERLRPDDLLDVLRNGRPATQMQGFSKELGDVTIKQMATWLRSAPAATPRWEQADIEASRIVYHAPGTLPDRPVFSADPSNLFLVVEAGTHHVSVLDGDKLEPIHRFTTRFALHGGPKFSSDGRYVYMASRDGWVSKYDLWNLKLVAEIRAGMNTRNLAVSEDGEWVMVGNTLPQTL
ncbi:MAG TPA: cytochrome C oxidase Cbb3, partial [Cupriavidus sp.]|nr:cytochrome C oxidase Cbb3 [Cupriavidus sp.]